MEGFEADLRRRLSLLETTLADASPSGLADRRHSRLTPLTWLAAAALLAAAFASGAGARELMDHGWSTSGLFNPGGALHCSGIQGMVPSEAAPILAALEYEVTWQVEDDDRQTHSYQTRVAPSRGQVFEGIQKGVELVIVVELDHAIPRQSYGCDD